MSLRCKLIYSNPLYKDFPLWTKENPNLSCKALVYPFSFISCSHATLALVSHTEWSEVQTQHWGLWYHISSWQVNKKFGKKEEMVSGNFIHLLRFKHDSFKKIFPTLCPNLMQNQVASTYFHLHPKVFSAASFISSNTPAPFI